MGNSKIIQTWTYLKADRRSHETLHTLPKLPPSVDGGNWLTAGQDLRVKGQIRSNINTYMFLLF